MSDPGEWRAMSSAPRDGSRILVTTRPVEQGPADVDVAYWARADQFGSEGWRAADSHPGLIVGYAEPELKCWMPLPKASISKDEPTSIPDMPKPYEGDAFEDSGSGI
jgi:hypothetical protein